jgi:hypothetical protein
MHNLIFGSIYSRSDDEEFKIDFEFEEMNF